MSLETYHKAEGIEIGLDEVGRGPPFGRLYTAGVVWPQDLNTDETKRLVKDSKKIRPGEEMRVSYEYVMKHAIHQAVDYATVPEVEQLGPLHADMLSMHRVLDKIWGTNGELSDPRILVDGNYFTDYYAPESTMDTKPVSHVTVVKGDSKYYSIAAASILAKYSRDQYILELIKSHPELDARYGIRNNKGYLTKRHTEGIETYGITEFHRRKYKCCTGRPITYIKPRPRVVITRRIFRGDV